MAIGLTLVVKPSLAPLLLLPLLNRQWRAIVTAIAVPVLLQYSSSSPCGSATPINFVTRTLPYILGTRDYFNSSILGNGVYYGLPTWLILSMRIIFLLLTIGRCWWLLYRYYRTRDPLFWMATSSDAAHRVVAGAIAWSGLLLDDAVPVPHDGGAAELGDPQLAGMAGDIRVHGDRQVAAQRGRPPARTWNT